MGSRTERHRLTSYHGKRSHNWAWDTQNRIRAMKLQAKCDHSRVEVEPESSRELRESGLCCQINGEGEWWPPMLREVKNSDDSAARLLTESLKLLPEHAHFQLWWDSWPFKIWRLFGVEEKAIKHTLQCSRTCALPAGGKRTYPVFYCDRHSSRMDYMDDSWSPVGFRWEEDWSKAILKKLTVPGMSNCVCQSDSVTKLSPISQQGRAALASSVTLPVCSENSAHMNMCLAGGATLINSKLNHFFKAELWLIYNVLVSRCTAKWYMHI